MNEASYPGNLGMEEFLRFQDMAAPSEKDQMNGLLNTGRNEEAWALLQKVVNVRLYPIARPAKPINRNKIADTLYQSVVNPETGNTIMVKTALGYPNSHPAHVIAQKLVSRSARSS